MNRFPSDSENKLPTIRLPLNVVYQRFGGSWKIPRLTPHRALEFVLKADRLNNRKAKRLVECTNVNTDRCSTTLNWYSCYPTHSTSTIGIFSQFIFSLFSVFSPFSPTFPRCLFIYSLQIIVFLAFFSLSTPVLCIRPQSFRSFRSKAQFNHSNRLLSIKTDTKSTKSTKHLYSVEIETSQINWRRKCGLWRW